MDGFSYFGRGNILCPDEKSVSIGYLIFNWEKDEFPSYKPVNGDRYALLNSVTAGVHLQAKGKVDAVCAVHKARQQDFKQCPPRAESSGLCRSEPLAWKCVLSAAQSLAVLTYWQKKVLHNCQFSASGTAPAFAVGSLWVSPV